LVDLIAKIELILAFSVLRDKAIYMEEDQKIT